MAQSLITHHHVSASRPLIFAIAGALSLQFVTICISWKQSRDQRVAINSATRQRSINQLARYNGISLGDAADFVDSLVERFNHNRTGGVVVSTVATSGSE